MDYGFAHAGRVYTPNQTDGITQRADTERSDTGGETGREGGPMKWVTFTWTERTTYEATVPVPNDWPDTTEAWEADTRDLDWFARVDKGDPDWAQRATVTDRDLDTVERGTP